MLFAIVPTISISWGYITTHLHLNSYEIVCCGEKDVSEMFVQHENKLYILIFANKFIVIYYAESRDVVDFFWLRLQYEHLFLSSLSDILHDKSTRVLCRYIILITNHFCAWFWNVP